MSCAPFHVLGCQLLLYAGVSAEVSARSILDSQPWFTKNLDFAARLIWGFDAISGGRFVSPLTLFGLFAVVSMLVTYAFEKRNPWFIFLFAASCALGSIYGFLQGAWPFGLAEAVWCVVAVRRWWAARCGSAASGKSIQAQS
jgi:hypothetical protein